MIFLNKYTLATLSVTAALVAPAFAETPVEKECKALLLRVFNKVPATEGVTLERTNEFIVEKTDDIYRGRTWSKVDQLALDSNKPLVKDYNKVIKGFQALDDKQFKSMFLEGAQDPKLTELQKRVYSDILVYFKAEKLQMPVMRAMNNGKDLYTSIRDYAINRDWTAPGATGDKLTANGVLRLLFEAKNIQEESPLFVAGINGFKKPDNKIAGAQAAAAGENIWAINAGVNILKDAEQTPLLITPLKKVNGKIIANATALNNQVVIICSDGSAVVYFIGKNGEIVTPDGNLLDPKHPIWKDKKADIRLPEPLKK